MRTRSTLWFAPLAMILASHLSCSGDDRGASPPVDEKAEGEAVGGPCSADGDCAGASSECLLEDSMAGGYCTVECGPAPCPTGSQCVETEGREICLDDCAEPDDCREGYVCGSDGACVPAPCQIEGCESGHFCNDRGWCERETCSVTGCPDGFACSSDGWCAAVACSSTATAGSPEACADGELCVAELCVLDIGNGPGAGPGPDCVNLPDIQCAGTDAECAELIAFDPRQGPGYDDYPINGETEDNQFLSYGRRDVIGFMKYASAKTLCKTAGWQTGLGGAIGIGNISEADGSAPGTASGQPMHPVGVHLGGLTVDTGYFQVGTEDNHLRPVCEHEFDGVEQYHCVKPPHGMDPWRTAYFLSALLESGRIHTIGVDGKAGQPILDALAQLCSTGWVTGDACNLDSALVFEEVNEGLGWFFFFHHHVYISFVAP